MAFSEFRHSHEQVVCVHEETSSRNDEELDLSPGDTEEGEAPLLLNEGERSRRILVRVQVGTESHGCNERMWVSGVGVSGDDE